jgi:hypothetical protein
LRRGKVSAEPDAEGSQKVSVFGSGMNVVPRGDGPPKARCP